MSEGKHFPQFFLPCFVYLAGPILDCTGPEANDWRQTIATKLRAHNIIGISPLRCEPLIGERYTTQYPDPCFGTSRAIGAKNKFDVKKCDITLAFLPKPEPGRVSSYGTMQEIAWADEADKRVILVTNDPFVIVHPVLDTAVDWKFATVPEGAALRGDPGCEILLSMEECWDAAVRTIIGVLGGYTGGKHV